MYRERDVCIYIQIYIYIYIYIYTDYYMYLFIVTRASSGRLENGSCA